MRQKLSTLLCHLLHLALLVSLLVQASVEMTSNSVLLFENVSMLNQQQ